LKFPLLICAYVGIKKHVLFNMHDMNTKIQNMQLYERVDGWLLIWSALPILHIVRKFLSKIFRWCDSLIKTQILSGQGIFKCLLHQSKQPFSQKRYYKDLAAYSRLSTFFLFVLLSSSRSQFVGCYYKFGKS